MMKASEAGVRSSYALLKFKDDLKKRIEEDIEDACSEGKSEIIIEDVKFKSKQHMAMVEELVKEYIEEGYEVIIVRGWRLLFEALHLPMPYLKIKWGFHK